AAGGDPHELDGRIESLGLTFQISTRLTTFIAVSQEQTVDPSSPTRREIVPQELPHGVSVGGLGLRQGVVGELSAQATLAAPAGAAHAMAPPPPAPPARPSPKSAFALGRVTTRARHEEPADDEVKDLGEGGA